MPLRKRIACGVIAAGEGCRPGVVLAGALAHAPHLAHALLPAVVAADPVDDPARKRVRRLAGMEITHIAEALLHRRVTIATAVAEARMRSIWPFFRSAATSKSSPSTPMIVCFCRGCGRRKPSRCRRTRCRTRQRSPGAARSSSRASAARCKAAGRALRGQHAVDVVQPPGALQRPALMGAGVVEGHHIARGADAAAGLAAEFHEASVTRMDSAQSPSSGYSKPKGSSRLSAAEVSENWVN